MARPGVRRIAPWVLAVLVGLVGATGVVAVGPRVGPAAGSAVREAAIELPRSLGLPPAGDRVDPVERSEPVRGALDLVLAAGIAVLALGATGFARRTGAVAAAARHRRGQGATRGPPAIG